MHRYFVFGLLVFFAVNNVVYAWSSKGHYVVASIAESYLSPKAKKELNRILGGDFMAEVANEPDFWKSDSIMRPSRPWHYVSIPNGKVYGEVEISSRGDVIQAILAFTALLKGRSVGELPDQHQKNIGAVFFSMMDRKKKAFPIEKVTNRRLVSKKEKKSALAFLVHFIGDIHQPLHVGLASDRGGNKVKLKWTLGSGQNFKTNLHSIWDKSLVDMSGLSYLELARHLNKPRPKKRQIEVLQSSGPKVWAKESVSYREQVYDLSHPKNVRFHYYYTFKNRDLVYKRLLEGGVRLAGVLNSIFGN